MARIQLFDHDGTPADRPHDADNAAALLCTLGIEAGRWTLRERPVSSTPLLTYARELHTLQRRFGTTRTDHVRTTRSCNAQNDWRELAHEHVHDEHEVRIVLDGALQFTLRATALGGWATLKVEAGDWVALPPGLPHMVDAGSPAHVDVLRLFGSAGGWTARPTRTGRPPRLPGPEIFTTSPSCALAA